ncbi:MAG: bifunctional phosphoribosylaminoimidazolecarboxamide formyltransferase/IMP cyclohydrolase, partial [bacterium]
VNLYPFEQKLAEGLSFDQIIEFIDIGGQSLIRAAAKNLKHLIVVVDQDDYASVLEKLHSGGVDERDRRALALKAFQRTASYDIAISAWLSKTEGEEWSDKWLMKGDLVQALRYGENPHQKGAFYATDSSGLAAIRVLGGKELSYNNLLDADAALRYVSEFVRPGEPPFAVIIKHTNAIGAALRNSLDAAYRRALEADPVSAFGGIVGLNREVDEALAIEFNKAFYEIILAPKFSETALETLKSKKNLRIIEFDPARLAPSSAELRSVLGGLLVQSTDWKEEMSADWKLAAGPSADSTAMDDLRFAWTVCKHIKSNAIVLVQDQALVGVGAGQPNRVQSMRLAIEQAKDYAKGSVLASDAFFPFRDNVDTAAKAGVKAIVQPGGSVRDEEVIAAANGHGISLYFTGRRHFRH